MPQESDVALVKVKLATVTNPRTCDGSNTTDVYVSLVKDQTDVLIGVGLPDKNRTPS